MGHTDIRSGDWVERLPAALVPYARLARLDRPAGVWLLLLPSWWALAMGHAGFSLYLLFAVGAFLMRPAGCIINDLWDRDIDAKVERTRIRPLASGTLKPKQALGFLALLLGLSLLILVQLPFGAILLGVVSLVLVAVYPLMKRVTWWPQAFLGLTFNWGILMGAASVSGKLPLWVWPLYAAGILWTLGYDTIYAHQDIADDELAGVKSTARHLGKASRIWVGAFYAGVMFFLLVAGFWAGTGWGYYPVLLAPLLHFVWQVGGWNMDDPADCLRRFRSNRDFGLLVLAAIAAGMVTG